mmetsp:Transcript_539/g.1865  ORF Transcript_539/g.1865 Transcript_539/m.1865 type:complete len:258 (+) Transcript_539:489-1262(+)
MALCSPSARVKSCSSCSMVTRSNPARDAGSFLSTEGSACMKEGSNPKSDPSETSTFTSAVSAGLIFAGSRRLALASSSFFFFSSASCSLTSPCTWAFCFAARLFFEAANVPFASSRTASCLETLSLHAVRFASAEARASWRATLSASQPSSLGCSSLIVASTPASRLLRTSPTISATVAWKACRSFFAVLKAAVPMAWSMLRTLSGKSSALGITAITAEHFFGVGSLIACLLAGDSTAAAPAGLLRTFLFMAVCGRW